jgi:hypothetical protein
MALLAKIESEIDITLKKVRVFRKNYLRIANLMLLPMQFFPHKAVAFQIDAIRFLLRFR